MKRIRALIATLLICLPIGLAISAPVWAAATDTPASTACQGTGGTLTGGVCKSPGAGTLDLAGAFKLVANTLIFIVGAISVIMIIIGGLRYVLSGGDSAGVKGAKDTILYAIVGVVVAILAYAIVNFVISRIG
jgi:hypothetical protein